MKIFGNSAPTGVWYLLESLFSKPKFLFVIFLLIPLVGLFLSFLGFSTAFQRSGAVLVAAAIYCVFLNHFAKREIEYAESFLKGVKNMKDLPTAIRQLATQVSDQDQATKLAVNVYSQKERAEKNLPAIREVTDRIVIIEFLAGSIGTLIWGFGDLPFTKCLVCT